DLDAILAMALRRDPRERYATAAAFREDLERFLNQEPVLARRGAALYRARKFVGRYRASVATAALVAATLIAAVVITRSQLIETRKQRTAAIASALRADANAHRADESARRAETNSEFLQLLLSEEPRSEPLTIKGLLERSEELLKNQYADRPLFIAE